MQIIKLTKQKMKEVYETHMRRDFPDSERKPLSMILKGMDDGSYECLGLEKNGEILGYAIFVHIEKRYLFDYLAVIDGGRNKGVGTMFLSLLREYYKDADSVIGEVEDPDCARSEGDKNLQNRRLHFYLRNGYLDTQVRVKLFGVDYIVLEMDLGQAHSKEQVKDLYRMHYKMMLPKLLYYTMVKVKEQ